MTIQTLILGATSVGIGYALSHSDCIIAEKGMNLCVDYTDCMNICPVDNALLDGYTPEVREMYAEAMAKNLVGEEGALHPFPLIGITAAHLLAKEVSVLSFCEAESVQRDKNGFFVHLYCVNSHITISCEKIIDATAYDDPVFAETFLPSLGKGEGITTCIAASLRTKTNETTVCALPNGARIIRGRFADEAYLELSLSPGDSYREGFAKLHTLYQKLSADSAFSGYEYIDTAGELIYRTPDFSFTKVTTGVCRLRPATKRDIFFNLNAAYVLPAV
ncbi:MAG TPA: hypothetical protein H9717_10790 [Candidatus Eisenbergiella merdipullorum]|uniref:Uncharacterized protein n=1 Tax=Candidatus Eisenbergiella merdipullorum TaxID=2838553 RepID=A0A9D2I837_9FIRM|nr:hypothetical protein [Candidatus Eisenbergiella merdipullorum]